jgi:hypothetical protein
MASPKSEVFFLYDASTGAPAIGVTGMSFDTYKNDLGADISNPTISEIGGGAYKFTPVFASPDRGLAYVLNTNSVLVSPTRVARYMRPEDWNLDQITDISSSLVRALGMLHENSVLDNTAYNTDNNLLSGRLRIYGASSGPTKTAKENCDAAIVAGPSSDYLPGMVAEYQILATYVGSNLLTYEVVKA